MQFIMQPLVAELASSLIIYSNMVLGCCLAFPAAGASAAIESLNGCTDPSTCCPVRCAAEQATTAVKKRKGKQQRMPAAKKLPKAAPTAEGATSASESEGDGCTKMLQVLRCQVASRIR